MGSTVERCRGRYGGLVTDFCLGSGGGKGRCSESSSPEPAPLSRALPASWFSLPHPGGATQVFNVLGSCSDLLYHLPSEPRACRLLRPLRSSQDSPLSDFPASTPPQTQIPASATHQSLVSHTKPGVSTPSQIPSPLASSRADISDPGPHHTVSSPPPHHGTLMMRLKSCLSTRRK